MIQRNNMPELKDAKEYPFEFDTPIQEVVETEKMQPVVDPETKQVSFEKVIVRETREKKYHRLIPYDISCADSEHDFYMKDTSKYIAGCSKCSKNRILSPIRHVLKGGKIYDRDTGALLA